MGLSVFNEAFPWWNTVATPAGAGANTWYIAAGNPFPVRIDQILLSTDDTNPVDIELDAEFALGFPWFGGRLVLPAGAGMVVGVPSVDLLAVASSVLANCVVPPFAYLGVKQLSSLSAGATLWIFAVGGILG